MYKALRNDKEYRWLETEKKNAVYNLECDYADAYLIPPSKRKTFDCFNNIKRATTVYKSLEYINAVSSYIEEIINGDLPPIDDKNDERKYGSFDESGRSRVTVEVIKRSQAARHNNETYEQRAAS